ncbi:MAG: proline--tRNA ligase [bacterium]
MKMSKMFINTLRKNPADAEVVSHQLLVRAGYIRRLTSGVYSFLPLMLRVLKKIENIVRKEMDNSGAQELLLPILQPKELWQESNRWGIYGKELMRFPDRHTRMLVLGPTHEEVITSLARSEISSYKQLPVNLYQIQSKFRDEIRPRFGLLRGREFIMKDAYSFDIDEAGLDETYNKMIKTYTRIFFRCGLETRMVESDSGAIGGNISHEFMVLTKTNSGENDVLYCNNCSYAANSNRAESKLPFALTESKFSEPKEIDTPNIKTIEELTKFLDTPPSTICKTLVYIIDSDETKEKTLKPSSFVIALIRGDQIIEEIKLKNAVGANEIRIASDEEIKELARMFNLDTETGFIGPANINIQENHIIADKSVIDLKNFVIGINKTDKHLIGANWHTEDINLPKIIADIRLAQPGNFCSKCENGKLEITKGIEVGNIFKLGTKYSEKMNAKFTDENGKEKFFIMGCYGIGISRTAAAAVERFHDKDGIKFPMEIAPYHVVVVPVNIQNKLQWETALDIYNELNKNQIEVVLDDRDYRAGVKFKDADLIGFPIRITVGKTIDEGLVEIKLRSTNEQFKITKQEVLNKIKELIV